jgi:osmotically-inducible protein OsmY
MPNDRLARPSNRHLPRPWALVACLALSLALPLLQGCAAALIGAGVGAAVGATVVVRDRRDPDALMDDKEIEFKSRDWPGAQTRCQVAVNSYNRVVLLTGQCQEEAAAKAYAERISRIPKVSQVVDEITIGPFASLSRQSEDTLITSRAKLALVDVDIPGFDPTRVTVITESGIVYLMGLVTTEEAEAAAQQVRHVPGVVKVVKVFEITQAPAAAGAATPPRATPGLPEATGGGFDASP